tara:strand:+ start:440 stop:694 length:255 start_codon:yes stop_codon:yes gene_type:complete
MKKINPREFGLSKRVELYKDRNKVIIKAKRKSRIIMNDGLRFFEIAKKIKENNKEKKISLLTNAPICSKTKSFLMKKNISILEL